MIGYVTQKNDRRKAEERVQKARALRFPNGNNLLDDRSGSPVQRDASQVNHAHQHVTPLSPAPTPTPHRADRLLNAFDSEYTGSTTSRENSRYADIDPYRARSPIAPLPQGPDHPTFQTQHFQTHVIEQGDRPNSQSSDIGRLEQSAEKMIEEQRQRRLMIERSSSRAGGGSYPSTTSGRPSTPEVFQRPFASSRRPPSTPSLAPGPHTAPNDEDQSLEYHRSVYVRQAADAYQRQHQQGPTKFVQYHSLSHDHPLEAETLHHPFVDQQRLFDPTQSYVGLERTYSPGHKSMSAADAFNPNSQLDYDNSTLYAMSFAQLRDESFDLDPSAAIEDEDVPLSTALDKEVLLGDRLAAALEGGKEEQETLLKGLPASDWEAVDSWFTAQFAELAAQRTAKRNERRDIARQFEDKVAERFKDVDAEQSDLQEALQKMRTTGSKVLEVGTPSRK